MSTLPTFGVEEEFALVDGRRHDLVGRAAELLDRMDPPAHGQVDLEMKLSQVETVTPVCRNVGELRLRVTSLRHAVGQAARSMQCEILAGGTHPLGSWSDQALTPKPAYQQLDDAYQRLSAEQVLFGCHVHVSVDDPDLRIAVLDRVRSRLAPLLALTANSPFWEGDDTGYASYRYVTFSRWPTFATPEALGDWAGYEALLDTLVGSGAIDSPRRLYWTVRPSAAYPTLEFRIADVCIEAGHAVMLAAVCRALVMTAIEEIESGAGPEEVRGEAIRMSEWHAARYGLHGEILDPCTGEARKAPDAVGRLLDRVGPALERAGDLAAVSSTVESILMDGNGADRQRRVLAATGSMRSVLRELVTGRSSDHPHHQAAATDP